MSDTPVSINYYPASAAEAFTVAGTRLNKLGFARRLSQHDPSLFSDEIKTRGAIVNRLGWLESFKTMREALPALESLTDDVRKSGLDQVVLVGMGGSSLCPEVLGRVFGLPDYLQTYIVLDSTSPEAVRNATAITDPARTLVIVASKSGGTVETRSHADFFFERQKQATDNPGAHFLAITDEGSSLEQWGREANFRGVFLNPADIGGRFSAISYFGLAPAALLGIPLEDLLTAAETVQQQEQASGPAGELGAFLVACADLGRDKITFLPSPGTAPLIPWVEQLLAESTGKGGRGIFPIEGEPAGTPAHYAADRAFVFTRFADEPEMSATTAEFAAAGFPAVEIVYADRPALGGAFLQWEWATAAAGCLLGVNPFDEPNVTESKNNTGRLLEEFAESGQLPIWPKVAEAARLSVRAPDEFAGQTIDLPTILAEWCKKIKPGDYVALLAYLASAQQLEEQLTRMRLAFRDRLGVAALRGWGPRFLHSIGQLYKGGPARGHFIVITAQIPDDRDIAIPGRPYSFGRLITAQALGDAQALVHRDRPVLQIELDDDPRVTMETLGDLLIEAIASVTG